MVTKKCTKCPAAYRSKTIKDKNGVCRRVYVKVANAKPKATSKPKAKARSKPKAKSMSRPMTVKSSC